MSFLGSRVARRVFWLFFLCTLLPLALSDGVATSAVDELARSLQSRSQSAATRQTAFQVFDRLSAAKAALLTLAGLPAGSGAAVHEPTSPQLERMFARVARTGIADAHPPPEAAELHAAWRRADDGVVAAPVTTPSAQAGALDVELRIDAQGNAPPRLLLAAVQAGEPGWIAELRPAYVWGPLADAAIDSSWLVRDSRGRTLAHEGEAVPAGEQPSAALAAPVAVHATRLFLHAEFSAGDFEFEQRAAVPELAWRGMPLARWLMLVALATLLLVAFVSLGQIRRLLVPLDELTAGVKRLSIGGSVAPVRVRGNDEFAELGRAFNDMAARLDGQFRSLESLASVDRAVLAGSSPLDIARGVLGRLASADPGCVATIAWIEGGERGPAWLRVALGADGACTTTADTPATHEQLNDFDTDVTLDAGDARLEGMTPAVQAAGGNAVFPVRWNGRTRAVLVIGETSGDASGKPSAAERGESSGGSVGTALALAPDLRERLAVAFSACKREREMLHRAGHDSLTGLVNRHGLNELVDWLVADPSRASPFAVLFIDLDHFKHANDALGHEVGDSILCEAARRLCACAEGALVARQGGDEFVIVVPGGTAQAAGALAVAANECLARPFEVSGQPHSLGASIGYALFPQHGLDRQQLLRHADIAMYAAKAAGRGRAMQFDEAHEAAAQRRLHLPAELRRALEHNELMAFFQPRVEPRSGRITSAEALVRWQHPTRGLLLPGQFIGIAEESSLIEELGLFMLDAACAQMAAWRQRFTDLARISVNVSPRQLARGGFAREVRQALERHRLEPCALELEVTESLLVVDAAAARAQLSDLRGIGVSIALDDFGTGYSSMAMLRDLPLDVMKIDRSFVLDLEHDPGAFAITRTIATLARSLELHLVAEGVETQEQARLLQAMGCNELQGFLYSGALDANAFASMCERGVAMPPARVLCRA